MFALFAFRSANPGHRNAPEVRHAGHAIKRGRCESSGGCAILMSIFSCLIFFFGGGGNYVGDIKKGKGSMVMFFSATRKSQRCRKATSCVMGCLDVYFNNNVAVHAVRFEKPLRRF